MPISAYPADAGPGAMVTERQWCAMALLWAPEGVVRRFGSLAVTAGPGFAVTVATGDCWAGGGFGHNPSDLPLVPLAPHPTNARLDTVVMHWDWVANTVDLRLLAGAPGVVPAPAPLAREIAVVYDWPLAQVRVRAGATGIIAADVVDVRQYTDAGAYPTGAIVPWMGYGVPAAWLVCSGQALLRAEYPALFAVLGTTFGSTGATDFRVPDLRGRVLVGLDGGAGRLPAAAAPGAAGGGAAVTLGLGALPQHFHPTTLSHPLPETGQNHEHSVGGAQVTAPDLAAHAHSATVSGSVGVGTPHRHGDRPMMELPQQPTGGTPEGHFPAPNIAVLSGLEEGGPHQHPVTMTGTASGGSAAAHSHVVAVGTLGTAAGAPAHAHRVVVPSTTTAPAGAGGALPTPAPWRAAVWVIKP